MADELTVAALARKRAELAGRIAHARAGLEAMLASLAALDATLRLFDPGMRPEAIRPRPFKPEGAAASPGMRIRDVLGALRETGRPMTSREIAERLLAGRGAAGDAKLASRAGEIVGAALRKLGAKGTVERIGERGGAAAWRLAEARDGRGMLVP